MDFVNPFIGTTNFGTTNPGAGVPNGLMRVTPFNVMGSDTNRYDKDARWWSTPYDNTNSFFTGFAHGALSGVGCPDLGSLLLTATTGKFDVDYHNYGTAYSDEQAVPGWYSLNLDAYGIKAETTATARTARTRFTFPCRRGQYTAQSRRRTYQRIRCYRAPCQPYRNTRIKTPRYILLYR